jgi:predicted CopG family antitoxin
MGTMYRTQILIEQEQHEALRNIARHEKRSLSDVIREMVRKQLEDRKKQELAIAAKELQEDYRLDPELTAFTSIDGEDFDLC